MARSASVASVICISFHMDRILMQYANIFQAVDKLLSLRFNWLVFLVLLPSYIWFLSLFISVAFRLKFHCSCWWCCCCILNLNHFSVGNSLHHTHTHKHTLPISVFCWFVQQKNVWLSPLLPDAVAAFAVTVCAASLLPHWWYIGTDNKWKKTKLKAKQKNSQPAKNLSLLYIRLRNRW